MPKTQIDEQTIKAYYDAIEEFSNALTEAFKPVEEWFNQFADCLAEIANAIIPIFEQAADIAVQYLESINAIDKREKERSRWSRIYPYKIKPLLIDKRSKIHRCRNAI